MFRKPRYYQKQNEKSSSPQPSDYPPSRIPRPSPRNSLDSPPAHIRPRKSQSSFLMKRDQYAIMAQEVISETDTKKDAYIESIERANKEHQAVITKGVRDILDLKKREGKLKEEVEQLKEQLAQGNEAKQNDSFLDSMVRRQRATESELKSHRTWEMAYQKRIEELQNQVLKIQEVKENTVALLSARNKELETRLLSQANSSKRNKDETEPAAQVPRTNGVAQRIEKLANQLNVDPKAELLLRTRCRILENDLQRKTEREAQLLERIDELESKAEREAQFLARIAELESKVSQAKTTETNLIAHAQQLEADALKTERDFHMAKKMAEAHKKCLQDAASHDGDALHRTQRTQRKQGLVASAVPIVVHMIVNINAQDPSSRNLLQRLHSTLSTSSNPMQGRAELGRVDFHGPEDAVADIMKQMQEHDEVAAKVNVAHRELLTRFNLAWNEIQRLRPEMTKLREENKALRTKLDINAAVMEGLGRGKKPCVC